MKWQPAWQKRQNERCRDYHIFASKIRTYEGAIMLPFPDAIFVICLKTIKKHSHPNTDNLLSWNPNDSTSSVRHGNSMTAQIEFLRENCHHRHAREWRVRSTPSLYSFTWIHLSRRNRGFGENDNAQNRPSLEKCSALKLHFGCINPDSPGECSLIHIHSFPAGALCN